MNNNLMFDAAPVTGIRRTSDGYLVADARVARTGIQLYAGSDIGLFDKAIARVYRPADEVFGRDALQTYAHRPVTLDHPTQMVDAGNWKELAVGQTGDEVVRDGDFVRVPLVLMDSEAIKAVENGKRELSMGYTSEIEIVDGITPEGEPYDAIQRNLRMNHLAVVAKARGGSNLRIGDTRNHGEMDMADAIKTRTVLVDGLPIETTDAGAQAIEKLQRALADSANTATQAATANTAAIAAKDAELATKDAEIDALKAKQLSDADIDTRVTARAELIAKAKNLHDSIDTSGLSDDNIRKAVVVAKLGDARVKDKSQAYIDASFDLLLDEAEKTKDGFKKALANDGDNTNHNVNDADPDKAYAENVASMRDAWKRKEA